MPTRFNGKENEVLSLNAYIKLLRASDSVYGFLMRRLRALGITPGQLAVMEALHHLGPLNPKALAYKLLRTRANMTTVIDNLERFGWVQRSPMTIDKRFHMIQLTESGQALIARIFPIHKDDIVSLFSVLTPDEQSELGRLCKKLGMAALESGV